MASKMNVCCHNYSLFLELDVYLSSFAERKEISISETGMFAYVAICTITLMQLFPETWNDKFNKEYIETLCGHLKINQRIKPALLMLMEEQNCQDLQAYIELLRTESMLENRLIMIIKDMVTLAVQQGNVFTHFSLHSRLITMLTIFIKNITKVVHDIQIFTFYRKI